MFAVSAVVTRHRLEDCLDRIQRSKQRAPPMETGWHQLRFDLERDWLHKVFLFEIHYAWINIFRLLTQLMKVFLIGPYKWGYVLFLTKAFTIPCSFGCDACLVYWQSGYYDEHIGLRIFIPQRSFVSMLLTNSIIIIIVVDIFISADHMVKKDYKMSPLYPRLV